MTGRDLFEAMGAIDEDLVLAADEPPARPRHSWRPVLLRAVPLAACMCLIAGAVLWQMQGGAPGNGAAPETAAADIPEEAAQAALRSEEAAGTDSAQARAYDGVASLYNGPEASVSAFPGLLSELLDQGSGPYTAEEPPQPADRSRQQDWKLPDTVPVFRSMAAARTVDTSGMYGRMRSLLTALDLDPALADEAVYTGLTQEQAEEQAAVLRQNGGSESAELQFWADAGTLTLEVSPFDAWPEGLTMTADNTGTVTAQVPGAQPSTARQTAEKIADTVRADWPGVAALAGEDCAVQLYSEPDGGWHVRFYSASDTPTGLIESGDLNSVEAALEENGRLCRVVWHNADLTEAAGEYVPLTRAEAEELLRQGVFLTDGGSLDGAAVLENLADVRLYYPESRDCAWYLPYWCFTADEGTSDDGDAHVYCEYLVPAVSQQDLNLLAGTE